MLEYAAERNEARRVFSRGSSYLAAGVSVFALACAPAKAQEQSTAQTTVQSGAPAAAATAPADNAGEIVVTGIRASYRKSQDLKRDSDIVQDSITADDIGALPDRSVTEALQRIPGISINFFSPGGDTQRYASEGTGVTIRGLSGYTRSEFNGREAFSVSSGRGLGFESVPAELLGGVDVFKSTTADRIEGGIAGTVNLRTRLPFDQRGRLIAFSAEGSYGDLADEITPTVSALFSDRWSTGLGDFGILVNAVHSELRTRADSLKVESYLCRQDVVTRPDASRPSESVNISQTKGVPCFGLLAGVPGERSGVYLPRGVGQRVTENDRVRQGGSVALQWKSTDNKILATAQYIRSKAKQSYTDRIIDIEAGAIASQGESYPIFGSDVVVGPNGIVQEATIQGQPNGREGSLVVPAGREQTIVLQEDGTRRTFTGMNVGTPESNIRTPFTGLQNNYQRGDRVGETLTQDFSFNLRWDPTERLRLTFDAQHVKSSAENIDNRLTISGFENASFKTDGREIPTIEYLRPTNRDREGNVFPCPTTRSVTVQNLAGQNVVFPNVVTPCPSVNSDQHASPTDPHNYYWRDAMDHFDDGRGTSNAFRLDGTYKLDDDSWLNSISAGARWAEREQVTRNSAYNFGTLSDTWGGLAPAGPVWLDEPLGFPNSNVPGVFKTDLKSSDHYEAYNFPNFFSGEAQDGTMGQGRLFPNFNTAKEYEKYVALGKAVGQTWRPFVNPYNGAFGPTTNRNQCPDGTSNSNNWNPVAERCGLVPGTIYLPSEINPVREENKAAYVSAKFGFDLPNEMRFAGTVGVRYTHTERQSSGFEYFVFPSTGFLTDEQCNTNLATSSSRGYRPVFFCALSPERRAAVRRFSNGAQNAIVAKTEYDYILPSLNARLEVSPRFLVRFAAYKAVTPPSFGTVRAGSNVTLETPSATTSDFQFVAPTFAGQSGLTRSPATGLITNGSYSDVTVAPGGLVPAGSCISGNRNAAGVVTCTDTVLAPIIPASQVGRITVASPNLKPVEADNLDLSFEWYFAPRGRVGSLTLALFHKTLSNLATPQTRLVPYTNNGETFNVYVTNNVNSPDKGKIKGFELAYQQAYDFLPGVLSGFGINANYTHIRSKGVPQLGGGAVNPQDIGAQVDTSLLPLVGLSKHNANFAVFYEKFGISARLAYNWRSDYLLAVRDSNRPNSPITQSGNGQLDGSLFYDLTKNLKVGVQGVNLNNKVTRTNAVINNKLEEIGRNWFVNDRRFTFVVRARY